MSAKTVCVVPFNRVEGDLKVRLDIEEGRVTDARCSGIMYRGFENILKGRGPLDGLVITPRICGICSTSHLSAAAKALDSIFGAEVPDNGLRIRNITGMAEMIQNDTRHSFLLFMADFTHPHFRKHPLYEEAQRRYTPMKGSDAVQTVRESRRILEIIALLGGQWPHSSFMVPGGVVTVPSPNDISQCRFMVRHYRRWYERQVLGCAIERWREIQSRKDLDDWLEERPEHQKSAVGFFLRFSEAAKLEEQGRGDGRFISFGGFDMPRETGVKSFGNKDQFLGAGFLADGITASLDQEKIVEDLSHCWFENSGPITQHPFSGKTRPYATGSESDRYSWAKAPRYDGHPAECGPLAQLAVAGDPLMGDLAETIGSTLFTRVLARLARTAILLPALEGWLQELADGEGESFHNYDPVNEGEGFGLVEAPRGALGHWVKIRDKKIQTYQIITPTAWNASPRDQKEVRGPIEASLVNTTIENPDDPFEAGLVIRSFDPCLVCTVHAIET